MYFILNLFWILVLLDLRDEVLTNCVWKMEAIHNTLCSVLYLSLSFSFSLYIPLSPSLMLSLSFCWNCKLFGKRTITSTYIDCKVTHGSNRLGYNGLLAEGKLLLYSGLWHFYYSASSRSDSTHVRHITSISNLCTLFFVYSWFRT